MSFPVLDKYLAILSHSPQAGTSVWLDAQGRVQGMYFNCTLTSAFQPIRALNTMRVIGFEAYARSYSEGDAGLSLWKILDHAANDDESVELDRLCRMLHAINFFRQPGAVDADLYLAVHSRLLTAVSANHGIAFRCILEGLGLPIGKIVLQLPAVTKNHGWLLSYVADNYRRNGFRFATNVANVSEALDLLRRVRPDVIKIDAHEITDEMIALKLLEEAEHFRIQIVFKRMDDLRALDALRHLSEVSGNAIYAQGYLLDVPTPSLSGVEIPRMSAETKSALALDDRAN